MRSRDEDWECGNGLLIGSNLDLCFVLLYVTIRLTYKNLDIPRAVEKINYGVWKLLCFST